jgi:Glyoxalase/Bleomycin resistance protein/Dioxygenase superfamily
MPIGHTRLGIAHGVVEGPNIYEEFLNERGEGVHHLGYFVEDIDADISNMESRDFSVLQSGRGFSSNDDGDYAHFDTERALGSILEALEMPPEMPPPKGRIRNRAS